MITKSAPIGPRIQFIDRYSGGLQVRIDAGLYPEGVNLQTSTDLVTWVVEFERTFGTMDLSTVNAGQRFYRVTAP